MTLKEFEEMNKAFLLQTIAINDLKKRALPKECAEKELRGNEAKYAEWKRIAQEKHMHEAMKCERRSAS